LTLKVSRWMGYADTGMIDMHSGNLLSHDDDINAVPVRRSVQV
jgi:hypothetical protein